MRFRIIFFLALFTTTACGGGDKHLPSSNPPEYDPKKVYSPPIEPSHRERATAQESPPVQESPAPSAKSPPESRSSPPLVATGNPADLAKRILAGGPESHRTLIAALTAAGFAILDSKRGTVVGIPAKPEMGLPLEDWEVEILARAAADQMTVPFSELEADLALALKDERAERQIMTMLLDEIRTGVNDSSSTVRTWASLIVELGRQSATPYDLLTVKDFTSVHLTGLQQVLMLKYLAAEFFALGIQRATTPTLSQWSPSSPAARPLRLVAYTEQLVWRISSLNSAPPAGSGRMKASPHRREQADGGGA